MKPHASFDLLSCISDFAVCINAHGVIEQASKPSQAFLQLPAELLQESIELFIQPEDMVLFAEAREKAKQSGEKQTFICRLLRQRVLPVWVDCYMHALPEDKSAAHSDTEIMNDEWNRSRKRIAAGLLQLSIALGRGIDFRSALSITLEVLHDSMGFNRVIAFFRDDEEFKAGLYVGNLRPEKMADLYFSRKYAADVFHLALRQKADVFIQDVALSRETTIPIWFRKTLPDARAFILLPLVFNNSTIGIIYADWRAGQTRVIRPREFSSLVMLRNYLMKALMK